MAEKIAINSVKELREELKKLKDVMVQTEKGTEAYNNALSQSAEIQHTLKEQMEEVNASAMDFGQIVGNCTKSIGGMVAGFQAATAVMNLFGVENEDVLKSMQKMQQLMSLTQALPAIDNGVKAFKRLSMAIQTTAGATSKWSKALISTGIGAIAVALGYLITNFDEISKWLDKITGQTDFVGTVSDAVIGGLNAGWAAIVQTLKAVGNAIVTYVTTPFNAVMNAINAFSGTNGSMLDKLKAATKAMKNGFVSDWKDVGDKFKEIGVSAANAYQSGFESHKAKRLAKQVEEAKEIGNARGNAKAEAEEAAYKKALKDIDKSEREEMLKLQALGLSYEEYVKKKQELEDEFTKRRIETLQNIIDTEVNLTEEEIARLQEDLIKLQDSLYKKPEESGSNDKSKPTDSTEEQNTAELVNQSLGNFKDAINEIADDPAWGNIIGNIQSIITIFDDLNKNHIEKGSKEAMNAYMQVAALGFGAVGQMLNGLAAEQDQTNKEGFETAKKMQIASATMTTLSSVLQALAAGNSMASQMGLAAPVGWALGAAMATMVGALGATNIAKIAQTKFGGGNSASATSATPSSSAITTINAPVQYTQDVQGASIEGSIKDSRVYVLESDITDTQNKVDVVQSEAKF